MSPLLHTFNVINFVLVRQAGDFEISHGPSGVSRCVKFKKQLNGK